MQIFKKIRVLILLSILLSGCAFYGPVKSKFDATDLESSLLYKGAQNDMALMDCHPQGIVSDTSQVVMCPSQIIGVLKSCKQEEARAHTVESFTGVWGEPKLRGKKDGLEYLKYNKSIAWRGYFMIFVVVPVPLVAPKGHNETILWFKNGKLSRVMIEQGDWNFEIIPIAPFPAG